MGDDRWWRGFDAVGVDPQAPPRPRLLRSRVEELGSIGRFDAVCAVMTLRHVELGPALARARAVPPAA